MWICLFQVCERGGDLLSCDGHCYGAFHLQCIGLSVAPRGKLFCNECKTGGLPLLGLSNVSIIWHIQSSTGLDDLVAQVCPAGHQLMVTVISACAVELGRAEFSVFIAGVHTCFVCKKSGDGIKRCIIPLCGKFYHSDCISAYPGTQPHNKGFRCPLHVCLSCHISNPLNVCSSKGKF